MFASQWPYERLLTRTFAAPTTPPLIVSLLAPRSSSAGRVVRLDIVLFVVAHGDVKIVI